MPVRFCTTQMQPGQAGYVPQYNASQSDVRGRMAVAPAGYAGFPGSVNPLVARAMRDPHVRYNKNADGSYTRVGPYDFDSLIMDGRRDFKRLRDGMSGPGVDKLVKAHNKRVKNPALRWHGHVDRDLNGDLIPDYIIHQGGSETADYGACNPDRTIAVNGWTTKRSDWPIRYLYNSTHQTAEERALEPMDVWLHNKKAVRVNDDGTIVSMNDIYSDLPENWDHTGYKWRDIPKYVERAKRERGGYRSGYDAFANYLVKDIVGGVIDNAGVPKKLKMAFLSKINSQLYWYNILKVVLPTYGSSIPAEVLNNYKAYSAWAATSPSILKSKDFKSKCVATVHEFAASVNEQAIAKAANEILDSLGWIEPYPRQEKKRKIKFGATADQDTFYPIARQPNLLTTDDE